MSGEKTAEEVTAWLKEQAEASVGRWKDGIGPPDFPAFVEMILGSPLRPRQEDMFRRAKIITPDDFLDPERETIEIIVMWGKGCHSGETYLTDTVTSERMTMEEWSRSKRPLNLWTMDSGIRRQAVAGPVYRKGRSILYLVTTSDGRECEVTSHHRFLTPLGWKPLEELSIGSEIAVASSIPSNDGERVPCRLQITEGFQGDYRLSCHSYGGQLPRDQDTARCVSPLQYDVRDSNLSNLSKDDQEDFDKYSRHSLRQEHTFREHDLVGASCSQRFSGYVVASPLGSAIPLPLLARSIPLRRSLQDPRWGEEEDCVDRKDGYLPSRSGSSLRHFSSDKQCMVLSDQPFSRLEPTKDRSDTIQQFEPEFQDYEFSYPYYTTIKSIEATKIDDFYDLTVPETHCYFDDNGILHHNSGKDMTMALLGAWVAAIICSLAGDPATYFGMAPGSTMYWVNVATNEDQATRVYFRDNLLRFIQHPYFAQFKPSIKSNEVWFPKSRLQLLSRHSHVAGLEGNNVIGFVMDEPDGMLDNQKRSLAGEIHEVFRSSAATRTTARPPLGVIIGYPWSDMGWLMRMKERVETALRAGDKQFFFDLASVFEVRPEVKRDHPIIAEEYRFNPRGARCKYECIAGSALDAWIDFPEKIYAANDPSLPFACEWDEVVTTNASGDEMIGALLSSIERKPGCEYFLGGDGAVSADSFTLAVWHVETSVQSAGWICRDCGGDGLESDWEYQKSVRMGAQYRRMPMTETVEYGPSVHCGICGVSPLRYGPVGMYAQVPGWWRNEIREQTADVKVGIESFSIPLIVEDALIEFKPKQAILHGEKNKPVDYVTECGVAEVTLLLMRELSIREAAFDPSHAVGIVQSLRRQGLNANTILFTTRPQYDRARLAKVLLYAGALKMLSPEAAPNDRMKETLITRNMEWKQIQQEKRKIQHPDGGRKDCWDAETVAIHLAASYIAPQLVNYHWEKDLDDQAMDRSRLIRAA